MFYDFLYLTRFPNGLISPCRSGGVVDLAAVKANPNVGAIMWAGYPGQAGGAAPLHAHE